MKNLVNTKKKLLRLAKEEELVAARQKAEELEKENTEMANKLAKKEQELDQKIQEKVNKLNNLLVWYLK